MSLLKRYCDYQAKVEALMKFSSEEAEKIYKEFLVNEQIDLKEKFQTISKILFDIQLFRGGIKGELDSFRTSDRYVKFVYMGAHNYGDIYKQNPTQNNSQFVFKLSIQETEKDKEQNTTVCIYAAELDKDYASIIQALRAEEKKVMDEAIEDYARYTKQEQLFQLVDKMRKI